MTNYWRSCVGLEAGFIQPRAEAEADEAAAWYEAEQPGLGIEFLLELDAAKERAAEKAADLVADEDPNHDRGHHVKRQIAIAAVRGFDARYAP